MQNGRERRRLSDPKIMKRVSVTAIISIVLAAMLLLYYMMYFSFFGRDRSDNQYTILRLNADSNPRGDGEDYILRSMNSKKVLRYSFETGEETEYYIEVPEGESIERGGVVVGDQVYYVLTDDAVRRYDCGKQTDEEIFSKEDIHRMYGQEELSEHASISITRYGECVVLFLKEYLKEYIYVCPMDGDFKTDCVEVNTLFPKEDRTGREQSIRYHGMRVKRYYDAEKDEYVIIELGDEGRGPVFFSFEPRFSTTIRIDGELISMSRERGTCSYWVEGDLKEHKIDCLNTSEFNYSVIQQKKSTIENGEIIGLVHVIKNFRCESWDPSQDEVKYDVLFRLDPKTGKNSILYRTKNNRTRIIGYQDGVIYLMNNYKIYTRTVGSKRAELFLELPRDTGYMFDWQGDYLIVMRKYTIFGAYKVR